MFAHARPVVLDAVDVRDELDGNSKDCATGKANGHANGHTNGYANGHSTRSTKQVVMLKPSILEYPAIFMKCFAVVCLPIQKKS